MQFDVLGPLVVTGSDGVVPVAGGRTAAITCWLLLNANKPVSVDSTVQAVWPTQPPASAPRQVRSVARSLAALFGPGHLEIDDRMLLRVDDEAVDAWRFERLVHVGRGLLAHDEVQQARASLDRALELWRGEPYPELDRAHAAIPVIDGLIECRLDAVEHLHGIDLAGEVSYRLVAELRAEVIHHPGRPRLWQQLAIALYRTGRQTEALAALAESRSHLAGADAAVRQLETAIVCHDPDLARGELTRR